jgi:cell filamentation protein
VSVDPYTDPATGLLRNKLGITDRGELAAAEADITTARIMRLAQRPIPGGYDLPHLQAIHKEVFGSIYPWAGQIRTVEISKQNTQFCRTGMIHNFAEDVFGTLARKDHHLQGLGREDFLTKLADLYGNINALHPFREGNGRAQRAFLAQLAADAGHRLDWTGMDPERNRLASIASFTGPNAPLRMMLAELTAPAADAVAPGQLTSAPIAAPVSATIESRAPVPQDADPPLQPRP